MKKPKSNPYVRKLTPVMMKYLTGRFGVTEGTAKWKKTLEITQQYWDDSTYIGGKDNILADNLYMSEILFAAVEACDRDFPGEDITKLGDELMVDGIRKLGRVINGPKLVNRHWVQTIVARMYGSYIRKAKERDWGNTWTMEVNPYGHKDGLAWRFTSCPVSEFAREHDLLPWAKYLCQMDHRMAEAAGCRLLREHTLVAGDDECDYWIVGDNHKTE